MQGALFSSWIAASKTITPMGASPRGFSFSAISARPAKHSCPHLKLKLKLKLKTTRAAKAALELVCEQCKLAFDKNLTVSLV